MRQKSVHAKSPSERLVKNIRRVTRKRHSTEEKICIVLDGLRGESSIAELCRREGIAESLRRKPRPLSDCKFKASMQVRSKRSKRRLQPLNATKQTRCLWLPIEFFISRAVQFATLTARDRIPASYAQRDFVSVGGLMSY